jgi:hypothetical protein
MKLVNKRVSNHFESFYNDIAAHIGAHEFYTNPPNEQLGACRLENEIVIIRLRTDISRPRFEQNAAHELLHALQIKEGWPTIKSRLRDESIIAQVASLLASIVLDLNVEDRLKQTLFDSTPVINDQYRNLKKIALEGNIPLAGSNRFRKAVMMYAYASLTQPHKRWAKLKELFSNRAPHITKKGEELASILIRCGWNNPDQALASMIAIRESIGLSNNDFSIIDRITEQRF